MVLNTAASVLQNGGGGLAGAGLIFMLVWLAFVVAIVGGMWKTFEKAGEPGWAAIIPIYNVIVMLKIADRELWWLILIFFIGIVIVIPYIDIAKKFGKGAGYGIGMLFLPFIFWPLLGFGDAQYQGGGGAPTAV